MRKLLYFFVFLVLIGCTKTDPPYTDRTSFFKNIRSGEEADSILTVLTYNIHLGFPANLDPWNKDDIGGSLQHIQDLAALIKSVDPDIIALQEVPLNRYNVEVKDFIRALATELNMNFAFGAHGYNDPSGIGPVNGQWGNAILSKFEILNIENRETEFITIWERRSTLRATIRLTDQKNIQVYSLHFLPSDQSLKNSASFFSENQNDLQLIMGDFNMTMVPELTSHGFDNFMNQDSTYKYYIDRILFSDNKSEKLNLSSIPGSEVLSDHPAVYAVLKIK